MANPLTMAATNISGPNRSRYRVLTLAHSAKPTAKTSRQLEGSDSCVGV